MWLWKAQDAAARWFSHHSWVHYRSFAWYCWLVSVDDDKNQRWSRSLARSSSSSSSLSSMKRLLRRRQIHFLFLLFLPSRGRTDVGPSKNVDRLEWLSSHFRERLACTHTHTELGKETIFQEAHIHIHQGSSICACEWRKLVQWCNDVCRRKRIVWETAIAEEEEEEEREREMGIVQTTASPGTGKKRYYASHSERRRKREREKEIRECLVVVVVLITTLKIGRTRSRRFCWIFDTENVSSWSGSILLTSSAEE